MLGAQIACDTARGHINTNELVLALSPRVKCSSTTYIGCFTSNVHESLTCVGNIRGTQHALDLVHVVQLRTEPTVHTEDFFVDDGRHR